MRNPKANRWILLAAMVVVVVCGMARLSLRPSEPLEPIYRGKPMTYWLDAFGSNQGFEVQTAERVQLDAAMHAVGTNAIPTLLRMMRVQDSSLKLAMLALLRKQHLIKVNHVAASTRRFEASQGFEILGPQAAGSVPDLIAIFNHAPEPETAEVFGWVGPEARTAVPSLIHGLSEQNSQVRHMCLWSLGRIHALPDGVVPALINALNDPVLMNQITAVNALGCYGPDARSANPRLLQLLNHTNVSMASEAATALQAIDPEAAAKAGGKTGTAPPSPIPVPSGATRL